MNQREKIGAALAYLKSRGVSDANAAPPLWRLLRYLGLNVPPPHFISFFPLALLTGIPFGVLMFALLVIPSSLAKGEWDSSMISLILTSGPAFGLLLSAWYRWSAYRMGLPPWSEFGRYDAEDEAGW